MLTAKDGEAVGQAAAAQVGPAAQNDRVGSPPVCESSTGMRRNCVMICTLLAQSPQRHSNTLKYRYAQPGRAGLNPAVDHGQDFLTFPADQRQPRRPDHFRAVARTPPRPA